MVLSQWSTDGTTRDRKAVRSEEDAPCLHFSPTRSSWLNLIKSCSPRSRPGRANEPVAEFMAR